MKFIDIVWAAFLARVNPVSTIAKPACMNITRKPASSVHTKLMAILLWPTVSITSGRVGFFGSFTVTSAAVPVVAPVGSPAGCPMAPCACAVEEGPVTELNHTARRAAANTFARTIARLFMSSPFVRISADTGSQWAHAPTPMPALLVCQTENAHAVEAWRVRVEMRCDLDSEDRVLAATRIGRHDERQRLSDDRGRGDQKHRGLRDHNHGLRDGLQLRPADDVNGPRPAEVAAVDRGKRL